MKFGDGMKAWAGKQLGGDPAPEKDDDAGKPANVRAGDLKGVTPEHLEQIAKWGKQKPPVPGNPPGMAKGHEAEWEKAKEAVKPHWDSYDEPWAVVTHVFQNMTGT